MALQTEEFKKVRGILHNLQLGRRLKRDRFRPFGGTINDRKHVGEMIGLKERTNQVNMNVREPSSWNRDMMKAPFHMTLNLTPLAA